MQVINDRREYMKGFIFSFMLGTIVLSAPVLASNAQQQDAQTIKIEQWADSNPEEFNTFLVKCNENKVFRLDNLRSCSIASSYKAEQISNQYRKEVQSAQSAPSY